VEEKQAAASRADNCRLWLPPQDGTCFMVTGRGQYATVPPVGFNQFFPGFCISFWFYFQGDNSAAHASAKIFDFGNGLGKDNMFVGKEGLTSNIRFSVRHASYEQYKVIKDGFPSGRWMHYIWCFNCTRNGDSTWYIYQNGIEVFNSTLYYPMAASMRSNFIAWSSWANAQQEGYFLGKIDSIALYSWQLTPYEIQTLFSTGSIYVRPSFWPTVFPMLQKNELLEQS
jgi:hypothetical protein